MIELMAVKFQDIVCVINYEDLVSDPAAALHTVAELCGLPPPADPLAKLAGDVGCAAPYRDFIARELARK
jgi:LPS sulfotransferase NodH